MSCNTFTNSNLLSLEEKFETINKRRSISSQCSDTPVHLNLVLSETIKFNNTNNPKNEEQKTKGSPQMIQNTHFTGLLTHTLSIYAQIYSLHSILRTFEQSE